MINTFFNVILSGSAFKASTAGVFKQGLFFHRDGCFFTLRKNMTGVLSPGCHIEKMLVLWQSLRLPHG